nr:MAG TPA: hypothetical protein [Caudoviricetes sp.]
MGVTGKLSKLLRFGKLRTIKRGLKAQWST